MLELVGHFHCLVNLGKCKPQGACDAKEVPYNNCTSYRYNVKHSGFMVECLYTLEVGGQSYYPGTTCSSLLFNLQT
jgi:hypothetical protein